MGLIIIVGIVIIVSAIVYLYIGYKFCSPCKIMGQVGKEIFTFVDRSKQFKVNKGVKIKETQVKKISFIKCVLCAPAGILYERLHDKKSKKRVATRHH